MACEENIRLLCIRALKTDGPDYEMNLLALFSELNEHFETPSFEKPMVEMVQSALHRPPDA
jgi:hypothetical protein